MTKQQLFLTTIVAAVFLGSTSAQGADVLDLVADDAPIVVVYDGGQKAMGDTALSAIWNEPGMQEFFAPLWEAARQGLRGLRKPGGIDLVALEPLLKSRVAVAVYPSPKKKAGPPQQPGVAAPDIAIPKPPGRFLLVAAIGPEGSPQRDAAKKAFADLKGMTRAVGGVRVTQTGEGNSFAIKDSFLLFGATELVDASLAADLMPLSKAPTYIKMAGQTNLDGAVLGIYFDYQKAIEMAGQVNPDFKKFMKAVGLNDVRAVAASWAPKGRGMMTTIFVDTPTSEGLLAALKAEPIDEKMLQLVPQDVQQMSIVNLDTAKLYDAALAMIRELAGPENVEEIDEAIRKAEEKTGVKFRQELLASIDVGTLVVIQEGGLFLPNITVVQKVRDAKAVDEALTKLLTVASRAANKAISGALKMGPGGGPQDEVDKAAQVEQPPVMQSVNYKGTTIKYANVAIVSPAYAIKDGYLYLAASPVELKDFFDSLARGSIADNEDWKFVRSQLTLTRPQCLGYGEFKGAMKKYYYLLPMLGSVVTALDQVPVKLDVGKLPGAEQFAAHLFGMSLAMEVTDSGIRIQQFSPTGTGAPAKWNMQMQMLGSMVPMMMRMSSRAAPMGGLPMGGLPMGGPPMGEPPMVP